MSDSSEYYNSVSLHKYWTNIAIPYFLSVLGFSLFVLFSLKGPVLADRSQILKAVAALKQERVLNSGSRRS